MMSMLLMGWLIDKYGDNLKALNEKIKTHLTDDQKSKIDALYERNTAWIRPLTALQGLGGLQNLAGNTTRRT